MSVRNGELPDSPSRPHHPSAPKPCPPPSIARDSVRGRLLAARHRQTQQACVHLAMQDTKRGRMTTPSMVIHFVRHYGETDDPSRRIRF